MTAIHYLSDGKILLKLLSTPSLSPLPIERPLIH